MSNTKRSKKPQDAADRSTTDAELTDSDLERVAGGIVPPKLKPPTSTETKSPSGSGDPISGVDLDRSGPGIPTGLTLT